MLQKYKKIHFSLLNILAIRIKFTIFAPRFTILNNRAIEKACKGSKKKRINQINLKIMRQNYSVLKNGLLKFSSTSFEDAQRVYNSLCTKYPNHNIVFRF